MKISFAIPAHNEEKLIAQCIESIQKEIARCSAEAEIVVVNNNSTDNTKEVATQFANIKVVDETNKGLVFARQCGMDHSDGELIANIDADMIVPTGWLSTIIREFENNPHLVALSGPHVHYDLNILERAFVRVFYYIGYITYILNSRIFKVSGMLQGGNFIVRRDAMEKIGGYDTSITFYGEDTDIAKRIFKVGKVKWTFGLPIYTTGRRIKEEGIITMGIKYGVNYIWLIFFSTPFTKGYRDIRE